MRLKRKIAAAFITGILVLSLCACGIARGKGTEQAQKTDPPVSKSDVVSDFEKGWTILVYICGSNLESDGYMATIDIDEMLSAATGTDMRFVIETGGAQEWGFSEISTTELDRFVISEEEGEYVGSAQTKNMGAEETLEEFLIWGAENYRSEHMGLILWNHGSGSINGVCFDENYDFNSLSLTDIGKALSAAEGSMGGKFDFIGFDACLMGTLETAVQLAPYAEYMVGSQEIEPGYGWDYEAIGEYLADHTDADGAELGAVICDSFYNACEEIDAESSCTLSVTDLDRVDEIVDTFDDFAKDLYEASEREKGVSEIIRDIHDADNFGGNNKNEGYTNMVDLGELIDAGRSVSKDYDEARDAIEDAVIYQVKGTDHSNACGLSIYYPLEIQGSQELSIFREICVSTYYLGFVDKIAHGYAYGGDTDEYDNSAIIANEQEEDWDYVDDVEPGESTVITFTEEPQLDEHGNFWFQLSPDGLNNTVCVEAMVFLLTSDLEDAICMGLSTDVIGDWETGVFRDNFDGKWFALDDGQVLCSYLAEACDGYDIFTSPILLNGEEKCLRFVWDYADTGKVYMIDVWDGISDIGVPGRTGNSLEEGDVITPLYDAFTVDTSETFYYYGEDYTYHGNDEISFDQLPDGDYMYMFYIDDIYGDYYGSDLAVMTIDGDDIYFLKELYN